jgi:hypothetical protein
MKNLNNAGQGRKTPGEFYPATPPAMPIRYILVGTYFHKDNDAYNYSVSEYETHAKYDIDGTQVLDLYMGWWPNITWSGNAFDFGANNKFCFIINDYQIYLKPGCRAWSIEATGSIINHEIFHTLKLFHTCTGDDFCNDTPVGFVYDKVMMGICTLNQNANCWDFNPAIPGCPRKPCDDWDKISNNGMDYNQWEHAFTLCQIERINNSLINGNGNSYIHSCNGCMPAQAFFFTPGNATLCTPYLVMLNGQGSFNENQYLIEICEIEEGNPDNCIGNYYNSGWKNGEVGKINLASFYSFLANKSYRVKLIAGNSNCPGTDEWIQTIKTRDCATNPPCCFDMSLLNPVTDNIRVAYHLPVDGQVSFQLTNLTTAQIFSLQSSTDENVGDYQKEFDGSGIPAGTYAFTAAYRGVYYSKTITKI